MDLRNLIETHLDLPRLSADLDDLGPPGRLWAVQQWTRADMAVLWDAAQGFRPLTLDDFVPPTVAPLVEVIHWGKNSMPFATYFEKRFCRAVAASGEPRIIGYNEQPFAGLTGPGYYVGCPSEPLDEVALDYTIVPEEVPPTWPPVRSNSDRLGRWVYAGLVDIMRGLSSHVTIGRVKRNGTWHDQWFVLVRRDRASPS
ncbi:MAG: hypothetical protein ABSC94_08085 [Polyangiaceae bacterium]|jgi:hypothetical protein